jgi:hypothetical protein
MFSMSKISGVEASLAIQKGSTSNEKSTAHLVTAFCQPYGSGHNLGQSIHT